MNLLNVTVIFALLVAGLAGGVIAVVVVGMQGRYRDRHPAIANFLARTARALNGDAEPPNTFNKLMH